MVHAPCTFIDKDKEKTSITEPALDKPNLPTVIWPRELTLDETIGVYKVRTPTVQT